MPWRREAGFTLLELLVVLAILALLAGLLPVAASGLPGLRFRADARAMAAALRTAQARAMVTGLPVDVAFDPAARLWQVGAAAPQPWPRGIEALELRVAGLPDAPARLLFLPDGSATAAVLRLAGGGRRAVLRIAWLGGRVQLDE